MKRLDEYIERVNSVEPSPCLSSQIMALLEGNRQKKMAALWQSLAVAASVAMIVVLGITIGSGIKQDRYLSINDNQIENFSILTSDDNQ